MSDRLERLKHEVKTFRERKEWKKASCTFTTAHACVYLSFVRLWGIYTNVADHKGTQRGRLSSYNKLLAYLW